MKTIRMRMDVVGAHLSDPNGSRVGDVLDVEDGIAEAYVLHRWADLVEKASPTPPKVETAVAPPGETATAPQPEPPVKRGPGRPRKGE